MVFGEFSLLFTVGGAEGPMSSPATKWMFASDVMLSTYFFFFLSRSVKRDVLTSVFGVLLRSCV